MTQAETGISTGGQIEPIGRSGSELSVQQDYDQYRILADNYSGFMRIGICDLPQYVDLSMADEGQEGVMTSASNEALEFPFNEDLVSGDRKLAVLPEGALDVLGVDKADIIIQKQTLLSPLLVETIRTSPKEHVPGLIEGELTDSLPEGEVLVNGGLPEYIMLSKFDTTGCEELKKSTPENIILGNGNVITISREKILSRLPELIALHESVFSDQAIQMGYYGGLHKEGIEEIINNPEFIPVAGFDHETGEALMFALFAADLKNMDALSWINPEYLKKVLPTDETKKALAVALVITSTAKGLGMFPGTVRLAGHEILHRTQADTVYVLSESSAMSIMYTPKVINRYLAELGFMHQKTTIEATYLAEQSRNEA